MSEQNTLSQGYDPLTRILHSVLALAVTHQLFISLILERPKPDEPLHGWHEIVFEMHEWVGLLAFVTVVIHAIWSLIGPVSIRWSNILPFCASQRALVMQDLRAALKGQLPMRDSHDGLAALVHGLGLLAVLVTATAGFIIFLFMPEDGTLSPLLDVDLELHELMSSLVWAYWVGHIVITVLHQRAGHKVLERIKPGGK